MSTKKSTRIRREEIIQAALQIIGEKGVNALTISAIAERAGMSDANIYRHFGGKQEILQALTDFIGTEVMGKAAAIAAGSRRPLEKLETIFNTHIAMIAATPGLPRFVFSEEVHLGDRRLAEAMMFRMGNYIETLTGIIAAGVAEGDFRPGVAPRETALTLLGIISFTALRWSISGRQFDITIEAATLWNNFKQLVC